MTMPTAINMKLCPIFFFTHCRQADHDTALTIVRRQLAAIPGSWYRASKVKGGWRIDGGQIPYAVLEQIESEIGR
jgi:hypothetical protein